MKEYCRNQRTSLRLLFLTLLGCLASRPLQNLFCPQTLLAMSAESQRLWLQSTAALASHEKSHDKWSRAAADVVNY